MKTRWSIGLKIFFLATLLILVTFAVALFSFYRTFAVNNESKEIAEHYIPIKIKTLCF